MSISKQSEQVHLRGSSGNDFQSALATAVRTRWGGSRRAEGEADDNEEVLEPLVRSLCLQAMQTLIGDGGPYTVEACQKPGQRVFVLFRWKQLIGVTSRVNWRCWRLPNGKLVVVDSKVTSAQLSALDVVRCKVSLRDFVVLKAGSARLQRGKI